MREVEILNINAAGSDSALLQLCFNLLLCFQCFILTFLILKEDVIYGGIHPNLLTFTPDQELEPSANEICHKQHVAMLGGCQAPTWHSSKAKQHQNQTGGAVGSSLVPQAADPTRANTFSLRGYKNNSLTPSYSKACDWLNYTGRRIWVGENVPTDLFCFWVDYPFFLFVLEREGNMHVLFFKLLKFHLKGLPCVSQWVMVILSVPVNSLQKTQSMKSFKILPSFSPVYTSWFSKEIYSSMEEIFRLSISWICGGNSIYVCV